jgi:hypothetical protein
MTVRRLVTGRRSGKSVVFSDGPAPTEHQYEAIPGMMTSILWATGPTPEVNVEEAAPKGIFAHPDPGHTQLVVVDFPPDSVMAQPGFDPQKAALEQLAQLPGFAERFEPDNPGMHLTDTVDYCLVLEGKVSLELDDGEQTLMETGDVVVQQRTRHAWRNSGPDKARVAFVLIGTGNTE